MKFEIGDIVLTKWTDNDIHINQIVSKNQEKQVYKIICIKCIKFYGTPCGCNKLHKDFREGSYDLVTLEFVSTILTDELKGEYL